MSVYTCFVDYVRVSGFVCVRACVRACMRACVHACVRACVTLCLYVTASCRYNVKVRPIEHGCRSQWSGDS